MRFIETANDIPRKGYIKTLFYVTDNDDTSVLTHVKSGELCELRLDVKSPVLNSISNYKLKFVKLQEVYQHECLKTLIEYLDNNDYDYTIKRSCDGAVVETRNFEQGLKIDQNIDIEGNALPREVIIPTPKEQTVELDVNFDEQVVDARAVEDDDIRAMSGHKSAISRYDEIMNYYHHVDDADMFYDEEEEELEKYRDDSNASRRYKSLSRFI